MGLPAAIVHLIGFPAAGKYTIACELARQAAADGHTMVVVDNHHINNVIFELLDIDGVKDLPEDVWDHVRPVRRAVMDAIEHLGPPDWSYVFTNVLLADKPSDVEKIPRMADFASRTGRAFLPVRLLCDVDELEARIVTPERRDRLKWIDPIGLRGLVTTRPLVDVPRESGLEIDVTSRPAAEVATEILQRLRALGFA